ncbi:MAG: argininosuccinate lyase [Candidatus Omnitrophica bacterium]|nr:argininosuccinate lyase [Candidatus Omnitrophota bacterium]
MNYDYRLAQYDIYHSMIHILALLKMGVLSPKEVESLNSAFKEILEEVKSGNFKYNPESEDIHTEIQNRIEDKLGDLALKLHSFRSRNDQIIFDERFYCLTESTQVLSLLAENIIAFSKLANEHKDDLFIGYTHTQRAQIIRFKDYILAYYWMFSRDFQRLDSFLKNLEIPIGCGALAGSYIRKEDYIQAIRDFKKEWGKDLRITLSRNPLSDVSDRDFLLEFFGILSILQMHLSRLAEDFILYSTKEFDLLILPEEFCTGSSLMPHKKNPDFLELVRGYTGRIYGNLLSLFTTMKGLPLTYNRDMQLDKEPLFSSVEIIKSELKLMVGFIKEVKLNKKSVEKITRQDYSLYATELAEYMVEKGMPFSEAHQLVGKLIRDAEASGIQLKDLDTEILKSYSLYLDKDTLSRICNPSYVIKRKRSIAPSKNSLAEQLFKK